MVVVGILVGALVSLLVLLAIPVELTFAVRRHAGRGEGGGTLRWLFGLLRLRLESPGGWGRAKLKPRERRGHRHPIGRTRWVTAALRVEGFRWRLMRLVRDLLRHVRVSHLSLEARLGLGDPADTGRLWAVVGPLAALLARPPVTYIAVEPEFFDETFEFEGEGRIRIVPLQLLFVALRFVLSPSSLRVLCAIEQTSPALRRGPRAGSRAKERP